MGESLPKRARWVQEALSAAGVNATVVAMPASTRTARAAAAAIGCTVEQIAKALVFRGERSGALLLVIASGPNRVDEAKIEAAVGEPVAIADAETVRTGTGYAVGGVPPIGHTTPLRTFIDTDLLQHVEIWAAAGTPNTVFRITPVELQRITGGTAMRVA